MRIDPEVERFVHGYIVTLYLFKALEVDRKQVAALKLGRVWQGWFELVSAAAERDHVRMKRALRERSCKIVLEEWLEGRTLHVMYVHRGYEHHCKLMPSVLKAKCEERLEQWLRMLQAPEG